MLAYRITPLVPAYLLLLGAVLILAVGPAVAVRRRHALAVAVSALAVLSLFFAGRRPPADGQLVRVLAEWLGEPALVLRVPSFEPFLWVLMVSLLAISLAARGRVDRLSPLSQAMLFALTAVACGVVLAGTYRTLALALLILDGTAALFLLAHRQPGQAVGRLLLGVLSSAVVVGLAQGVDHVMASPVELGGLFSLTIWLRLGLYPLVESEARGDAFPPVRLGWTVANLAVGLVLVSTGVAPWVGWLAGVTAGLHALLAWLEPGREKALAHAAHALAGGIMAMAAVVGNAPAVVAASLSALSALVALTLTSSGLGRPDPSRPARLLAYLPPLLASASLVGVPFTLGWEGRGTLYQVTWEAGALGTLALAVVVEGAALSVVYRYWRRLFRSAPTGAPGIWRALGAALAAVPFLVPVAGPRLLQIAAHPELTGMALGPLSAGALTGLIGSLLWALFLGYGRRRLLNVLPFPRAVLMGVLRLGWLLRTLGRTLDTLGRVLLRVRAVVEGEHYLAWAILLALGVGLFIVLR